MREPDRYLRGMFTCVGFRQTTVSYHRDQRFAGKSKNTWPKMISFAIDGILGFSVAPLRFILGLGFVISALSLIWGLVAIIVKLSGSVNPGGQGWASPQRADHLPRRSAADRPRNDRAYVARAYEQGKHRPLYLVASAEGLDSGPSGPVREHHVLRAQGQPAESDLDPSQ
jgi:dolichol-phosphate mannosyltransferase